MSTKLPFIPAMGKDSDIQNAMYSEGHLFFATDTGKIYLDNEGQRIPMGGGGVAVLYADATEIVENIFDGTYTIQKVDLEDQKIIPKETDLIINSDGRFFKIISYDEGSQLIKANLIAVSGTGDGSGGGGSGDGSGGTAATVTVKHHGTVPNVTQYIYGKSQKVQFIATATNDVKLTITYTLADSTGATKSFTYETISGEIHEFDLGANLYKGTNTLTVVAIGPNDGTSKVARYPGISCIELLLKESSQFNPLSYSIDSSLIFYCMCYGPTGKTLEIYIDGVINNSLTKTIDDSGNITTIEIPQQTHGAHTIKAVLSTGEGITKAYAEPLEYEVAFIDSSSDVPVIWTKNIPAEITNHDKLNIYYQVYNKKDLARAEVHLYKNDEELITSPLEVGYSQTSWNIWNISDYDLGKNKFTIACGEGSKTFEVYVNKDTLRDLDILTTGLLLNLTTNGRSNKENPSSRSNWSFTNVNNVTTTATFNNFNWYNNGWILDTTTGESFLRVSNGASVSIPLNVLNYTSLQNSLTFELRFKLRNVKSYKNLIKFEPIEDPTTGETIGVKKTVSSTDSVFASYYNNAIGFNLGTQEGFFKTKESAIVSGRYKENAEVSVTFVAEARGTSSYPLVYMYINGEMVSIVNYGTSDSFAAAASELIINSEYCDVDVYSIRVYTVGLSQVDVVHNYIADKADALLYDMNKIVTYIDGAPMLSYLDLIEYNNKNPENLSIPYCVVETVDTTDEKLPYVKGGKKKLNVTFTNPALDKAYEEEKITGVEYIQGCPSFQAKNIEFDVQGTSSQGYPRRNYKGKFKKKDDNSWVYTNGPLKDKQIGEKNTFEGVEYKGYYMDNDHSETTFTWKADYMESSMTHNTGFASFVKELYGKHPLQDYISGFQPGNMRTTIYGFPMIVFQKYADGTYEFIGRYNFNLDKGANNVIGFEYEIKHPILTNRDLPEVAECWEFKNNQGTRCSFKTVNFAEYKTNTDGTVGPLTVLDDFEYRYSYYEDAIDDAIDGKNDFASKTQEERNAYLLERMANLEEVCNWLMSTHTDLATGNALENSVIYNNIEYTHDTVDYRLAKFRNEFDLHFDREYCEVYFICTELLLQYDSRGKNMMLATWGPKVEGGNYIWYPIFYDIDTQLGISNSGVPSWDYDTEATKTGTFSTSDSALHNNLWNCFSDSIKNRYIDLRKNKLTYEVLNGYYSYNPNISKSYAMKGVKPVNIINIDQYWKYIAPTFSGYIDTSGELAKDAGRRFYCLQGSRDLQRELFLRNRFNFIDSSWLGGKYATEAAKQEVQIRYTANDAADTSDKYLNHKPTTEDLATNSNFTYAEWPHPLDTDLTWKITPFLKQYVSAQYDDTSTSPIFSDIVETTIEMPGSNGTADNPTVAYNVKNAPMINEQLVYFGGAEYISSLGDLSLKYPNEMVLNKLLRIKELMIGNDAEGYYNRTLVDAKFSLDAGAYDAEGKPNSNAKTLLEKLVLTGLGSLTQTMDVSGSEKLKEFRALKSSISGVNLAEGTQIEVLHLPETITSLTLIEPTELQNILTEITIDEDGNFNKGLYIEGITNLDIVDANSTTKIDAFRVIGGNMGYDSYKLLDKIVKIKQAMQSNEELDSDNYNKKLTIVAEDIHWSPYELVQYGEPYDSEKIYVKKTDNYTFESYTDNTNWESETLNGLIYIENSDLMEKIDTITSLELLNTFIASYKSEENYFRNPDSDETKNSIAYISGDIFVNNPSDSPISEVEIKNTYGDKEHFPELNIFVKNVETGYTAKFIDEKEDGSIEVIELLKYDPSETSTPTMTSIIPTRLHHNFIGWKTESGVLLKTQEDFNNYSFSNSNKVMVFTAEFKIKSYDIEFYDKETGYFKSVPFAYGSTIEANVVNPYRDDSALNAERRYSFRGWTDKEEQAGLVDISKLDSILVNVSDYKADKIYKFYAVFIEESVYDSITDLKYFKFETTSVKDNADYGGTGETYEGYQIYINELYNDGHLSGKITLPVTYEGKPIISIRGFNGGFGKNITHIFFIEPENCQLKRIYGSAFADATALQYVYLPEGLLRVNDSGFKNNPKLTITSLPSTVRYIGTEVLYGSFQSNGMSEMNFNLGGSVYRIGDYMFRYCRQIFNTLTIGDEGDPSALVAIGFDMFASPEDPYGLKDIIIYGTAERQTELTTLVNTIAHTGTVSYIVTTKGE